MDIRCSALLQPNVRGKILTPAEMMEKARIMEAGIYKQRVDELAEVYGSVRAVGKALNIDHAYLQRLCTGEKRNPSAAVLRKLGLTL